MPHPSITAQTYPHKPAIIMGGSGEIVTYKQLDERSNQGAQLFRSLGLKAGDVLAEVEGTDEVKYLHGKFGRGTWTFYGGHDPEDYTHQVGDPPPDLDLHPDSPV